MVRRICVLAVASVALSCFGVGISGAGALQAQPDTGCPDTPTTLPTPGGNITIRCKWDVFLDGHVEQSSPEIADLGGEGPSIVVGTRDTGLVYALQLADGATDPGWPVATGAAVDSSPTAIPGAGGHDDVVVDSGDVVDLPPVSLDIDHGSGAGDRAGRPDPVEAWPCRRVRPDLRLRPRGVRVACGRRHDWVRAALDRDGRREPVAVLDAGVVGSNRGRVGRRRQRTARSPLRRSQTSSEAGIP